ncbi:MAG: cytochrome C554 [Pirellulaceae bacterium]|nr:cytochrome C554 [Pirellulaceae bacterium]
MRRAELNRQIVRTVAGVTLLGLLCAGGCGTQATSSTAAPASGGARVGPSAGKDRGQPLAELVAPETQPPAARGDESASGVAGARDFPLAGPDAAVARAGSDDGGTTGDIAAGGALLGRPGDLVDGEDRVALKADPPGHAATPDTSPVSDAPAGAAATAAHDSQTDDASALSAKVKSLMDQEPLFVGWPQPRLVLVFTGSQYGFLEPCGCSGLENQKGGLIRRFTLLKELAGRGWPVVPVDTGNQVRRFGRQAEIKFQLTVEALRNMQYRAVGFGPDDLRLSAGELVAVVAPTGDEPSRFVCANVSVLDPAFTSRYLILEENGKRIGVTMVLGQREQNQVNNAEVMKRDAAEALREIWPALEQAACDLYVLVAHASIDESRQLARQFPQFPLLVTTGGAGEPTREPVLIEGTSVQMIEVGTKGMYASVVGLFDDPAQPLRYQRVPLDARFADAPEALQLLAAYQDQIREAGYEGLEIAAQPHPSGREFIGSAACADCHDNAWRVWKDGIDGHRPKHAHAYATLQKPPKRANIARNFDPECLSCHVVGWNPQKYFPYRSGYVSAESTPDLINVGCENCHGPGKQHTDAENGDVELSDEEIEALRQELVLKLEDAEQKCLECHDLDNSPDFQEEGAFEKYWAKVKH